MSRQFLASLAAVFLLVAANLGALQLAWRYPTGGRIRSEPAVAPGGEVYALSDDGYLYSFTASGVTQWAANLGGLPTDSLSIGRDGTAYAGMGSGDLVAVNPRGGIIWRFSTGGSILGNPVTADDGTVFVATGSGTIYSLSLSGSVEWSVTLPARMTSPPILDGQETLYLGAADGRLYALTRWGRFKWSLPLGGSPQSIAAGRNGRLYVLVSGGTLVAVSANGAIVWRHEVGEGGFGPLLGEKQVYVAAATGNVKAFTAGGKPLWTSPLGTALTGSWVLGLHELYVMERDSRVAAVDTADGTIAGTSAVHAVGTMNLANDGTLLIGGRDWLVYGYLGARADPNADWTAASADARNSGHGAGRLDQLEANRMLSRIPDYLALEALADPISRSALSGVLGRLTGRIESGKAGKSTWYVRRLLERIAGVGVLNPIVEGATVINDFPQVRAKAAALLAALPSLGARTTLIRVLRAESDPVAAASEMTALGAIGSDGDGAATRAVAESLRRLQAAAGGPLPRVARAAVDAIGGMVRYEGDIPDPEGLSMLISVYRGSYSKGIRDAALAVLEGRAP